MRSRENRSHHIGIRRIGKRRGRRTWSALAASATLVITLFAVILIGPAGASSLAAAKPAAGKPGAADAARRFTAPATTARPDDEQPCRRKTAHRHLRPLFVHYRRPADYLWSGEFHYFRLPSPAWLDIFQKMKAAGFNAVSLYFDWGYHSPRPGSTTSPACATWTSCWTWPTGGAVRDRTPGPVHQRRGRRRRSARLADHEGGEQPHAPTPIPAVRRSVDDPDRPAHRPPPADQRDRLSHRLPGRERVLQRLASRAGLHAAPGEQGPGGRHHRPADRQQQRHVQLGHRGAERRRPRLLPAGLQLLKPVAVERRTEHQLRPPGRQAAVLARSSRAAHSTRGAARATTSARS